MVVWIFEICIPNIFIEFVEQLAEFCLLIKILICFLFIGSVTSKFLINVIIIVR